MRCSALSGGNNRLKTAFHSVKSSFCRNISQQPVIYSTELSRSVSPPLFKMQLQEHKRVRGTFPSCLLVISTWPCPHWASSGPSANPRGAAGTLLHSLVPFWPGSAPLALGLLPFPCLGWCGHPPSILAEAPPKKGKKTIYLLWQFETPPALMCQSNKSVLLYLPVKLKAVPSCLRLFQVHSVASDSEAQFARSPLL